MKTFRDITMYCGDVPTAMPVEDVLSSFLASVCLQPAKFRDEVFIQLIKQLRQNEGDQSGKAAWQMLSCLASCCSPSKDFLNPLMNWLHSISDNHQISSYKTSAKYVLAKVYYGYK